VRTQVDPDGCGMILSSMAEREAMAAHYRQLIEHQGVPSAEAGPLADQELRYMRCQERPEPGSEWDPRLKREGRAPGRVRRPPPAIEDVT